MEPNKVRHSLTRPGRNYSFPLKHFPVIYKSNLHCMLALITANVKLNWLETTYPPPPESISQWFKNQTITYLVCLHWSQVLMMWYYCNCQPVHVTSLMAMDFPYYCLNFDTCVWQIESEGTLTNIFGKWGQKLLCRSMINCVINQSNEWFKSIDYNLYASPLLGMQQGKQWWNLWTIYHDIID